MELAERNVVITGAGSGIGAAAARRFSKERPRALVLADLDLPSVQAVADELGAVAVRADVGREQDIVDAVAMVEVTLCPEIFAAHMFRYPHAEDIARQLVPYLPFRFTEGEMNGIGRRGAEAVLAATALARVAIEIALSELFLEDRFGRPLRIGRQLTAQLGDVIFRQPPKYDTPWPVALLVVIGLIVLSGVILERRVRGVEVVA